MKTKLSTMACSAVAIAIQKRIAGRLVSAGVHIIMSRSKKPSDGKVNMALLDVPNLKLVGSGLRDHGSSNEIKWWGCKFEGPGKRHINLAVVRSFDAWSQKTMYEVKPGKMLPPCAN